MSLICSSYVGPTDGRTSCSSGRAGKISVGSLKSRKSPESFSGCHWKIYVVGNPQCSSTVGKLCDTTQLWVVLLSRGGPNSVAAKDQ